MERWIPTVSNRLSLDSSVKRRWGNPSWKHFLHRGCGDCCHARYFCAPSYTLVLPERLFTRTHSSILTPTYLGPNRTVCVSLCRDIGLEIRCFGFRIRLRLRTGQMLFLQYSNWATLKKEAFRMSRKVSLNRDGHELTQQVSEATFGAFDCLNPVLSQSFRAHLCFGHIDCNSTDIFECMIAELERHWTTAKRQAEKQSESGRTASFWKSVGGQSSHRYYRSSQSRNCLLDCSSACPW